MPQPIQQDPARRIIEFGLSDGDLSPHAVQPTVEMLVDLGLPWPAGLAPEPQPWGPGEMPAGTIRSRGPMCWW